VNEDSDVLPVSDIYWAINSAGVSLGAFAARCKVSLETLIQAAAGLIDPVPSELTRAKVFDASRWGFPAESELIYVGTRGPRGSVRWHTWWVTREALHEIMSEHDDLVTFRTRDNITVALNPRHVVTVMFGDEDTDCLMDQTAIVPEQSLAGELVPYGHSLENLQKDFTAFYEGARQLNSVKDPEMLDEFDLVFPSWRDLRCPRAFLMDLKQPFMDRVYGESEMQSGWHLWHELAIEPMLDTPVSFADEDGMTARIWLRAEQVTVLECPTYLIMRSEYDELLESYSGGDMSVDDLRKDLVTVGLFSAEEMDSYLVRLADLRDKSAIVPPSKKGRGKRSKTID